MTTASPILDVRNLAKVYPGGVQALVDASLTVSPGEFVAIIGRSGAGKSTLLRCMNRLVEPTSGRVVLESNDVTRVHGAKLRRLRQRVGMVFQQFGLVSRLTVLENVLAGRLRFARTPWDHAASILRMFPRADRDRALDMLGLVGIAEHATKRASELSGGQQQRVAIARVLVQDPGVILADEPIASLDPRSADIVMDTLAKVRDESGVPVVVNLHQVDIARRYATRVIGMRAGAIVHDDAAERLSDDATRSIYGSPDQGGEAA